MYSVQHVLWRGAMAISLVVVGGVGANVSAPEVVDVKHDTTACQEEAAYVLQTKAVKVQKLQTFDVVVIKGIPPLPEEA
jgi:hypothetical protein